MPTYTVSPMPGDSSRWKVSSNGRTVSRHNTKTNAIARARELRDDHGGTITVKGRNGQFQRRL